MSLKATHHQSLTKLILSGLFIALGIVLPFLTGQIPQVGSALLPMHIPVLLCGFSCGWPFGLIVGFITPVLRSLLFSMPPLFPTAVAMAFELASYGAMTGLFYKLFPKKPAFIYVSLLLSMLIGRLIWGLASYILIGLSGESFTFQLFITGAFINALPGMAIQIILIPLIVLALERAGLMPYAD